MTTKETTAMIDAWHSTAAYQQTTANQDLIGYKDAWKRFYDRWTARKSPARITRLATLAGPYWAGPVWDLLNRQQSRLDTLADRRVVKRAIGDIRDRESRQREREGAATVVRLQHLAAYDTPLDCIGSPADEAEALQEANAGF